MDTLLGFIEHIVFIVKAFLVWDVIFAQGARFIEYSPLKFAVASRVFDVFGVVP